MSAIHDMISQIGDPRLRERLAAECNAASTDKKFGLVFEDRLPELPPLPKVKPRRGDLVCRRQGGLKDVWQVKSVKDCVVACVKPQDETHPSEPARAMAETVNFALDEVLVVREFGEPIFPSLVPAVGLARFAERHGALVGRVEMIRKQASPAGGEHYARLEINKEQRSSSCC